MDEKRINYKNGARAILRHLAPFKKDFALLFVFGIISAIATGSIPYITGRFFDTLVNISRGESGAGLFNFPLWMILLSVWAFVQVVANNIDWGIDRLRRRLDIEIHLGIQVNGFTKLLRAPLSYHKDAHINGVFQKINATGWRVSAIVRILTDIAPQFLSLIIGIILAASINGMLASVLLAGVVVYVILLLGILPPIAAIDSAAHQSWNENWDDAAQAVTQVEGVKQATAEEYESVTVKKSLLEKTCNLWLRLERNWSNISYFQRMIVLLTQLTMFILSVKFVSSGAITIGELIALNGYAAMFFGPFVSLGHSWQTVQNGLTTAGQAEEIFGLVEEDYVPKDAVKISNFTGRVEFNDVSFSYNVDQNEILSNVNFAVNAGEVVAFVGESGVGKSTAISLISGYAFPTKGCVFVDGVDTRKLNLIDLRKSIAVVPQEIALFNTTIRANISYGSPSCTEDEIRNAAKQAYADDFIAALPLGYDTIVGERGIKLSVGQKQRISIARAILRNPKILILDEPTSALDSETERKVAESLEGLMKGRTTFIVAHRLSTVRKADKIFVIEKGKIVESGKHDELMKIENGNYRHRYELHIGLV